MERSTTYVVGFAAVLCLVCGIIVSSSAVALKETQERNAVLDRQKKVLIVAGFDEVNDADADTIERLFAENIKAEIIDLKTGEIAEGATEDGYDYDKAAKDPALSFSAPDKNSIGAKRLPNQVLVYKRFKDGQLDKLILPMKGKGLWGPMYGFVALANDLNTIEGLIFYKHVETPGLGGEIENPSWVAKWPGQLAFETNKETGQMVMPPKPAITVMKGPAAPGDPYQIDGLSGATITSRGVTGMTDFWLGDTGYGPYLARLRGKGGKNGQ